MEIDMLKLKTFLLIFSVCFLCACESDVDKCAKAMMKDGHKESYARLACLQVANGNKN